MLNPDVESNLFATCRHGLTKLVVGGGTPVLILRFALEAAKLLQVSRRNCYSSILIVILHLARNLPLGREDPRQLSARKMHFGASAVHLPFMGGDRFVG